MLRRWLATPRIGLLAALLAGALTLPSLGNGLGIDDHLYRARSLEGWSAARAARDLFFFADPDRPDDVRAAMQNGELSWWAAPALRWRCMRPIPQLVHYLEFRMWGRGELVWLHLHSIAWMMAVAAAAAALFRRLLSPPWVAGLAAILYAVDDGHGFSVGWVANRCVLMATLFAIGALGAHDRWRRDGWRPGALLAPLALAAALLCSEEALAIVGYIAAHVIVLDRGRRRACAIAPYAVVVATWLGARRLLGYGIYGTGSYTDALAEPAAFVTQALVRLPIYVHSQMGALPADLWEVYFVRRGWTWVMALAGLAFMALVAPTIWVLVRRDRAARFWALGGAAALVPVCGAHPTDRHLFLVGLGGAALVSSTLAAWLDESALLPRGAGLLAGFFALVHLVVAPIALPFRARIPGAVSRGLARLEALVPDDARLADQDLVLVNAPFKYLCNFVSVVRRSNGGTSPRRWRCLGVSADEVTVRREDAQTLVLRPEHGYLRQFEDTNVRSRRIGFAPGDRVSLPGLSITVRAVTDDARPAEVAFRFDAALEDPSLRWLIWRDGAYRRFEPPPPGGATRLAAQPFAWSELLRR
jgi:hypothetical protein